MHGPTHVLPNLIHRKFVFVLPHTLKWNLFLLQPWCVSVNDIIIGKENGWFRHKWDSTRWRHYRAVFLFEYILNFFCLQYHILWRLEARLGLEDGNIRLRLRLYNEGGGETLGNWSLVFYCQIHSGYIKRLIRIFSQTWLLIKIWFWLRLLHKVLWHL